MITRKIEISHKTVIFTVTFLLALAFFWQIRSIILIIFVGFVLMQAINPLVLRLEKIKIPRILAILIVYLLLLVIISFAIAGIIPILVEQTSGLVNTLPNLIKNVKIFSENNIDISSQFKILETIPTNIAKIAFSVVSNVFSGLIILVITFYFLLEKNNFSKYGDSFFGDKGKIKFLRVMNNIEESLGHWVNAQLLLMLIIGLLSYVGYLVLGLKYAVPLAILAGLLEAVPNIGPIITTVIASLVALTISPLTALFTVIFGVLVQQLENNFIVPKIMSKSVGLNPLITIILIAAGGKLAGIVGALLAIPIFLTAQAIIKGLYGDSK
ncbi:MAG: AI-2E family transporter [Candidatus Shapirobacteria bacterium]|jgi:predicted PurR-regulated permease PerM|nr:AI-2E family transporter [Candidatus Shapirobacteria bacterium]